MLIHVTNRMNYLCEGCACLDEQSFRMSGSVFIIRLNIQSIPVFIPYVNHWRKCTFTTVCSAKYQKKFYSFIGIERIFLLSPQTKLCQLHLLEICWRLPKTKALVSLPFSFVVNNCGRMSSVENGSLIQNSDVRFSGKCSLKCAFKF
jgi:hypothetical protein